MFAPIRECPCGSGHARESLMDARGIFAAFCCSACRKEKLAKFRPEVFTDSQYACDEAVEPDDDDGGFSDSDW